MVCSDDTKNTFQKILEDPKLIPKYELLAKHVQLTFLYCKGSSFAILSQQVLIVSFCKKQNKLSIGVKKLINKKITRQTKIMTISQASITYIKMDRHEVRSKVCNITLIFLIIKEDYIVFNSYKINEEQHFV